MCRRFLLGAAREAHDRQPVADFSEVRGSAVQLDQSTSRRGRK